MHPLEHPWPVVHRPYGGEAFGSWLGRIAARYRIGVDELVAAADIRIELEREGRAWLLADVPRGEDLMRLAWACRLPTAEIEAMRPSPARGTSQLCYCHHCLFLNPEDVTAPYWKRAWLYTPAVPCVLHPESIDWVSEADLRMHRNLRKLLDFISKRRIRRESERAWRDRLNLCASKVRGQD
jgi:hypothetical protein